MEADVQGRGRQLAERFGFKKIATTLRESISATVNNRSGCSTTGSNLPQPQYRLDVIDRVGGGDSFGAGLIYGLLAVFRRRTVEFAAAASCLKHSVPGDFNLASG